MASLLNRLMWYHLSIFTVRGYLNLRQKKCWRLERVEKKMSEINISLDSDFNFNWTEKKTY